MMTEDTLVAPYRAVVFCKEPKLRRLLEIELGLCGAVAYDGDGCELILWNPDDTPLDLSKISEKSLLICFSRKERDSFPEIEALGDRVCFLHRPFSLTVLEDCIKRLLLSLSDGAPSPLAPLSHPAVYDQTPRHAADAGQASWHPTDGGVLWNDRYIALTPREKALFDRLWLEQGRAVSKTELRRVLESDAGDTGETNTLEVYICHLRRKIEKPVGRRLITTVRGVGYRLENI